MKLLRMMSTVILYNVIYMAVCILVTNKHFLIPNCRYNLYHSPTARQHIAPVYQPPSSASSASSVSGTLDSQACGGLY